MRRSIFGSAGIATALGVALTLGSGTTLAQESENATWEALQDFQDRYGSGQRVRWDQSGEYVEHLWGARMETGLMPTAAEDYEVLARGVFADYPALFGVDHTQLEVFKSIELPLDLAGLTPKYAVVFQQRVSDVKVRDGWASVIFDKQGHILSIANRLIAGADLVDLVPRLGRDEAIRIASDALGHGVETVRSVDFEIVPFEDDKKHRYPALAWVVDLRGDGVEHGLPVQREFAVDAHQGRVLWSHSTIHAVDYIGNVNGWVTPAPAPDTGSNPEVLRNLRYVRVEVSGAGNADTDLSGDFVIPNGDATPRTATTNFDNSSTYAWVIDESGAEQELSQNATPGVPVQFTFNSSQTNADTAENNAQDGVIDFREYIKAQNPFDNSMDFRVRANVNLNSNCNAFFDGSSINFFTPGGGCVNTAYSTVVAHEEGHWANVIYGSGNGSDGFGEGNADNFATFIYDVAIVGQDFCGPGCHVRTGNNTRQYCGSCGAGCYSGVHANGEVLMGAFWKWRQNLNSTYGDAQGDAIADVLFMGWMNGYNDGTICDVVEEHILVLDDNDGNIFNGTPNFADIDAGFRAQGFPGIDLELVSIVHSPVSEQQSPNDVDVVAEITALNGSVNTAQVFYSTNEGASYNLINMVPTGNPDEYRATIPGHQAPEAVHYYIFAEDTLSNGVESPRSAPLDDRFVYYVGNVFEIESYGFETPNNDDQGWTHSGSNQDDWQRGAPGGKAGDPAAAYGGTKVWGNDIGPSGWNGLYQDNNNLVLTSPSIDFSGRGGARLQFRRWLTVEEGNDDRARIRVNGVTVWENRNAGNTIDDHWTLQDIDISAIADFNPNVSVTFELISDGSVNFGGWNLDDVRLIALEGDDADPPGDCVTPSNYGNATPGSGGIEPTVTSANGWPSLGNDNWAVRAENFLGGSTGSMLIGFASTSDNSAGWERLVVINAQTLILPVAYAGAGPGGGSLEVTLEVPNNPFLVGLNFFIQFTALDPGAPSGVSATPGLDSVICDPNA